MKSSTRQDSIAEKQNKLISTGGRLKLNPIKSLES